MFDAFDPEEPGRDEIRSQVSFCEQQSSAKEVRKKENGADEEDGTDPSPRPSDPFDVFSELAGHAGFV